MVQRKATIKLGIRSDHIKSEKLLVNQKPSSLDVKNGGADLKKKMKKSGSIKHPEFNTPSPRRHVKQPGKPPPTPQAITTPNYMKSTTSFDARKEKPQVTSKSLSRTSPDSLSLRRRNTNISKISIAPGDNNNKGLKSLARTPTSLKMMRTPSFKPLRVTPKRCSPVVLCENLDVQRATCSSTLKDRQFPNYLTLSPGATEAEGTSVLKVCPYTYCSLNGHCHAPVPPLKCFLSARRRMIKAQRSVKLGCLSPRRLRPTGDGLNLDGGGLINEEGPIVSPPNQDELHDGFFIEIYSDNKDNGGDQCHEKQVLETTSDGQISSDLDFERNLDEQNEYLRSTKMETAEDFDGENQKAEETMQNQFEELDSEASDMDWDTVHDYSALYLDEECQHPSKPEKDDDLEGGEVESWIIQDKLITKLEDSISSCFNEYLCDEVSQESFDEEGLSSDAWSSSDDGYSISSYDYLKSLDNKTSATDSIPVEVPAAAAASEDSKETLSECNQSVRIEDSSDTIANDAMSNQISADESQQIQTSDIENQEHLEIDASSPIDSAEEPDSYVPGPNSSEKEKCQLVHWVKTENSRMPEDDDSFLSLVKGKGKNTVEDMDALGHFNPREPNFLLLEPDPESEKVDLRHQELDGRKNAEEWMVDYALRQTVTKLAPARKRKVALLVEAFEKVMPVTKCELHMRHGSRFDHARPIQACS